MYKIIKYAALSSMKLLSLPIDFFIYKYNLIAVFL